MEIESRITTPSVKHDISFTPFDDRYDNPNFKICQEQNVASGRSRVQYADGMDVFSERLKQNFKFDSKFDGYVVVRFMVNCKAESDRYRAQALNLNFTPQEAPSGLLEHTIDIIRDMDNWGNPTEADYSKFINLKIANGRIQHVLL